MTRRRRVAAWLLLAAALGLAILGQIYLFYRREYVWDGVVLHLLAALCFLLAWRLSWPMESRAPSRQDSRLGAWLRSQPVPAMLLALGAFFSLIASFLSRDRLLNQTSVDIVLLWGLGVLTLLLAALWPSIWPPAWLRNLLRNWRGCWRRVRRETWVEAASVAALTLFALVLRVAALEDVPYTLGGDEAWHGLLARQVLSGELRNPFNMGYMSMPTLF
ncbi:MAG TPA: hypothetical protein VLY63_13695, partial [Anaerolineae bacterium]|nr:hypothetical protein [Anaerolineae bacterium]